MSTTTQHPPATLWAGPIAFAAIMMSVHGLFNVVTGLTAAFSDKVFIGGADGTLVLDVSAWGWVHLAFGVLLLVTGVGVLMGQWWARSMAVGLISLNMVSQLLLMPAYPFWSLVTIALGVVIVWALVVHGDEVPT